MTVLAWPTGQDNSGWPVEASAMMMPGRVQRWPAGTQVGGNAATNLLAQAVGWWDASFYRQGDRFLRNRGTGSELLDLRLGSSSVVATSNDPEFLGVADVGYVWLSGVAGNSLSMTAPATATQFIAYPLDESVATTTGVASGGATFTFSTVGAWRKIELLDVANVVLDTIDCDVIATGATTSFQSVQNQTVTVNRATGNVRKTVAMPSRWNGGRPLFLFGADDYMECLDTWQHNLIAGNTYSGFSVLNVYRYWDRTSVPQMLLNKERSGWQGGAGPGFASYIGASPGQNPGLFELTDGTSGFFLNSFPAAGSLFATAISMPRATRIAVATTSNLYPLRLGRTTAAPSAVNYYLNAEYYAAAVFRRALTAAEIKLISDFYTGA